MVWQRRIAVLADAALSQLARGVHFISSPSSRLVLQRRFAGALISVRSVTPPPPPLGSNVEPMAFPAISAVAASQQPLERQRRSLSSQPTTRPEAAASGTRPRTLFIDAQSDVSVPRAMARSSAARLPEQAAAVAWKELLRSHGNVGGRTSPVQMAQGPRHTCWAAVATAAAAAQPPPPLPPHSCCPADPLQTVPAPTQWRPAPGC